MASRKDTLTKTFRLDKHAFDLLEQEASKNGRSTNDIINRLVLRELEGERLLRPLKLVRISSQSLKLFTQALSQEKIAEIGQDVASGVITDSLSMQSAGDGPLSYESMIKMMKLFVAARTFEMSETTHGKQKVVIMYHNINRNYSVFLASYWKVLFAKADIRTTFTMDDDAVVIKFHE